MNDAFGYWFAGFADGEGSFYLSQKRNNSFSAGFSITQREDELPLLKYIRQELGFGKIYIKNVRGSFAGSKPQVRLSISDRGNCLRLVHILEKYPLKTKKAKTFELWAKAVHELQRQRKYQNDPLLRSIMKAIRDNIKFEQAENSTTMLPQLGFSLDT